MITFAPATPLEAAVLESGRFEFATDTAGREVLIVGHRRLPKVVMAEQVDGLHGLVQAVAGTGARAFTTSEGDPWLIDEDPVDDDVPPTVAEERLVMGVRPLVARGRPVRVAVHRQVVRLYFLPWIVPAETVGFGGPVHYVVTSARGVVGDWETPPGGRRGVVIGVPEMWVGIFERSRAPGCGLVLRCNVPVPWVGDGGLTNAVPTEVGVFEHLAASGAGSGAGSGGPDLANGPVESWVAKLPVVMVEGDVVRPVEVPDHVEVGDVPEGPWELEVHGAADFSMGSLT